MSSVDRIFNMIVVRMNHTRVIFVRSVLLAPYGVVEWLERILLPPCLVTYMY